MIKVAYYPGCSLNGTGVEYDLSAREVCRHLGVELEELPDWNCCGATSAHSTNRLLSYSLPARNLAIAQKLGLDLVIPCAACFNRMKAADKALKEQEGLRKEIESIVNFSYKGTVEIHHLLGFLRHKLGYGEIEKKVTNPLKGLKAASYYGCLLLRPPQITEFDDPEQPVSLDLLLQSLGADVLNWSAKNDCCGASLSLTTPELVKELVGNIVGLAKEGQAQCIVTACPLCQANLEMRQSGSAGLPIFYFTELLGFALGLREAREWSKKHLINVQDLAQKMSVGF